jgi:hypothetical protein
LGWVIREYNTRRNLVLCLISKEWDFAWQNVKEHVASRFQGLFFRQWIDCLKFDDVKV